jgi:hypothetical protein
MRDRMSGITFLVNNKEVEQYDFLELLMDNIKSKNGYEIIEESAWDMDNDFIEELTLLVYGNPRRLLDNFAIKGVEYQIETLGLILTFADENLGGAVNWLEDEEPFEEPEERDWDAERKERLLFPREEE